MAHLTEACLHLTFYPPIAGQPICYQVKVKEHFEEPRGHNIEDLNIAGPWSE